MIQLGLNLALALDHFLVYLLDSSLLISGSGRHAVSSLRQAISRHVETVPDSSQVIVDKLADALALLAPLVKDCILGRVDRAALANTSIACFLEASFPCLLQLQVVHFGSVLGRGFLGCILVGDDFFMRLAGSVLSEVGGHALVKLLCDDDGVVRANSLRCDVHGKYQI